MHNFRELKVWQKARELVKDIYQVTEGFPLNERYGLISQIQRSAISVPSNIAEGAGRDSKKEFNRFLDIAMGSLFELETQVILSFDLEYISNDTHNELTTKIKDVQKMLYGLKNSIKI